MTEKAKHQIAHRRIFGGQAGFMGKRRGFEAFVGEYSDEIPAISSSATNP
jgi:hypothetical protein